MATPVRYWCSIDGLELDLSHFFEVHIGPMGGPYTGLEGAPIGFEQEFWTDQTVVCPNGHHWAIALRLEFRRDA